MASEKAAICVILALLTIVAPHRSLFLFVIFSPWSIFTTDVLGWDPRLVWSLLLAARASFYSGSEIAQGLPRIAICGTFGFVLISYIRLHIGAAELPSEEMTGAAMALLYFFTGACAGYATLKLTHTAENVIQLISSGAFSLIVAGGFGLLQASWYQTAGLSAARISGTAGNPNYFAAHLALGATVMLLCWRLKLPRRRLYLVAALVATVACFFTFSRMGIIACLIGLALTLLFTRDGRVINWKLVAPSIATLVIMVVLTRSYLANARNTLPYLGDTDKTELAIASQEAEDLTRIEAVQFAFQQFLDQPVFGVGFCTIAARNYAANGLYVTTHDTYAQVLAGTGLVGGVLIAVMIVSLFRSIPLAVKRYTIPACAEFAFCSFFADFLQSIEVLVMFAILIATLRNLGESTTRLSNSHSASLNNSTNDPRLRVAVN